MKEKFNSRYGKNKANNPFNKIKKFFNIVRKKEEEIRNIRRNDSERRLEKKFVVRERI